jgi:hypothetical protein
MRTILNLGVLIAIAFFAGWLKMRGNSDKATIGIDGTEFRSDAEHVIDEGRSLINQGSEKRDGSK